MARAGDRLRSITNFKRLVEYLETDLGWPLDGYGFDEMTFEYEPAELGLKEDEAAKIRRIYQLRPPPGGMPWGIFFVDFENKKLPVVVLRRILSRLVIKKRASANKAERAAWNTGDLLFISSFGDPKQESPEIAFAHFHEEQGDLPTLRVLGWDGSDTRLKLDDVAQTLKDKLSWPADETDQSGWRQLWTAAFRHRIGHVIRTSDELAEKLAAMARGIRQAANTLLAAESEKGSLRRLHKAFQTALIHDLTEDAFADTYAQTITYGLLTAAISRTDVNAGKHGTVIFAGNVADLVPVTNPFLKEMLETFLKAGGRGDAIDFDELGIHDVVELLRGEETDLPAILRDFGNKNPNEDPVIHFYEHFLGKYDKVQKMQRGVFYTPQPVVSYIVRSVNELLQTEFGMADGLASTLTWRDLERRTPRIKTPAGVSPDSMVVQILDPATGTGTFLVETIELISRQLADKWKTSGLSAMPKLPPASYKRIPSTFEDYWNQYVPLALLPRLHGYELMMAPYAIAHMKIGLKLFETGYRFATNERARIYLTSALEPATEAEAQWTFEALSPALAHEANAVNEIKRDQRFTVLLGNPPYSINSCNLKTSAVALVEPFRYVDGVKIEERGALKFETILQDDYVKFWGLGIRLLESTPIGIIGLISNNGFLTNRVLRGVRRALMQSFTCLAIVDLHGNRSKGEVCPDGSTDDNVFDINQGVCVSILRKTSAIAASSTVIADLWGTRNAKYNTLAQSAFSQTAFRDCKPRWPYYSFALLDSEIEEEYRSFAPLDEVMPFNKAGFVSGRDDFAVDFERDRLEQRITDFLNPDNSDQTVRERYSIKDGGGYLLEKRRRSALASKLKAKDIIYRVQHRPFDYRFVAYSEAVLTSPQKVAMSQLIGGDNIAFCLSRGAEIIRGWEHIFCTRALVQHHTVSLKEVNYVFPLNIAVEETALGLGTGKAPNFSPLIMQNLEARLGLSIGGAADGSQLVSPKQLFQYAYATFHSPVYRARYGEFLKTDFPRLPLCNTLELFRALEQFGGELIALHLLESRTVDRFITTYSGQGGEIVERVGWSNGVVWIDAPTTKKGKPATPGTVGFHGVPEVVWNYHVGGYKVCEKWLKDRTGRLLSKDDVTQYQKIIVALSETIRLMKEIDLAIAQHGDWPGAFKA